MITREFSYLASQLKMNRTVEALLSSFAKRSGLDEVENFSVILLYPNGAGASWQAWFTMSFT